MAAKRKATKKAPQKKRSSTATGIRKREAENYRAQKEQRSQEIKAIILFAVAVLVLFVVLIKGQNVWEWLHNGIFGLFGIFTFLVPVFMIAIAVMKAFDKFSGNIGEKLIESGLLLLCLNTIVDVFYSDITNIGYFEYLASAFTDGTKIAGGGFIGALLGFPLEYALSTAGAAVILILIAFVLIMFVFDLTMGMIFKFFANLFKSRESSEDDDDEEEFDVKREIPEYFDELEIEGEEDEEKEVKNKKSPYDIPVDDIPEERDVFEKVSTKKGKKLIASYHGEQMPEDEVELEENEEIKEDEYIDGEEIRNNAAITENKKAAKPKEKKVEIVEGPKYKMPPTSLLEDKRTASNKNQHDIENTANRLVDVLRSFGVETRVINVSYGPTVTRYELQPSAGVKISKITNLADDIALNLATAGVRIEAPIPNKAAVGIEVPNKKTSVVGIRELIENEGFKNAKSNLTVAVGKDIGGNIVLGDIAAMPHGLIAGATGSGKSVCINSMIISLLYKAHPDDVKLLIIDPKMVELGQYNGIPHLLVPVVTDPRKASGALAWAINEMERRYKIFADNNAKSLSTYNKIAEKNDELDKIPQMVIIIDELADLMMTAPREVEDSICRLAQKARAAGIYLIIATQRPSVDVVTGLIKANIPSRIAFAVSSQVDSRTILDNAGAEKLLGKGDMLYSPIGSNKPMRVQGCFVTDKEIEAVIDYVKKDHTFEYDEDVMEEIEKNAAKELSKSSKAGGGDDDGDEDPMIEAAIDCVVDAGQASTSLLQRKLKLGYARAARIIDQLEVKGIVGGFEGAKPRKVLITKAELLEKRAGEE